MSRLPGTPEEKLDLLQGVDEQTFPHLVGDVLFYAHKHRNIRVVDGPGDGRRDIHSETPDGDLHITQCKYHYDTSSSVGSREADELVIALTKFGTKKGLFATSGRLSPQAKREYLDNYPECELQYMEGIDVVDAVLSSPILSAVWLSGESITAIRNPLAIPFIVRDSETDLPVTEFAGSPETLDEAVALEFIKAITPVEAFSPYRPPKSATLHEYGQKLHCFHAICRGAIHLYEMPNLLQRIAILVGQSVCEVDEVRTVRFGTPFFANIVGTDLVDRVPLTPFSPTAYVIYGQSVVKEREWILPHSRNDWVFPERFGHLQADWAGWYNPDLDCCFMLEIASPVHSNPSFFWQLMAELRKKWLNQSLFVTGAERTILEFKNTLGDDVPDYECEYGPGGRMIAWLHPRLDEESYYSIAIRPDESGRHSVAEGSFPEFQAKKARILATIEQYNLQTAPAERALHIAAAAGQDLVREIKEVLFNSAELVYSFEELASPANLAGRLCIFVSMWELPVAPAEALKVISDISLKLPGNGNLHWQAKTSTTTGTTFVMASLVFPCAIDCPTDRFLDEMTPLLPEYLSAIKNQLCQHWQQSKLATGYFWGQEIGIYFL